jgi:hypothetical protein
VFVAVLAVKQKSQADLCQAHYKVWVWSY